MAKYSKKNIYTSLLFVIIVNYILHKGITLSGKEDLYAIFSETRAGTGNSHSE